MLDPWLPSGRILAEEVVTPIPIDQLELPVCSFLDHEGRWNRASLQSLLPRNLASKITGCLPPKVNLGRDFIAWAAEPDCLFTTKSAYDLHHAGSAPDERSWKLI